MEQQFKAAIGLLKSAFDQLNNPFALLDEKGQYIYVNHTWEEASGKKMEEVLRLNVAEVVPDTCAPLAMKQKRIIMAHPVHGLVDKDDYYTTYTPLYAGEKVIGCAILVIFSGSDAAMQFSSTLAHIQTERNVYCRERGRCRDARYSIDNIIGKSRPIQELKAQIRRAANSTSTVLLVGETGTGKELAAHSIHNLSSRSGNPFVKINCATIPEDLAESELFGYEYGAFTGAKRGGKQGKFEMANTGSLFMDEINHLSPRLQPKLLRVLQEEEIEHIGGGRSIPVNVRLIGASNVPLEELVAGGKFRQDLYYRLNVVQIRIPPLRKRLEDIPLLADSIIKQLDERLEMHVEGISPDAAGLLQEYNWPGNVRELKNVLERAMNVRHKGILLPDDFSPSFPPELSAGRTLAPRRSFHDLKRQTEEAALREMLARCGGNKRRAAENLGISRTLLYRKINQYGLDR